MPGNQIQTKRHVCKLGSWPWVLIRAGWTSESQFVPLQFQHGSDYLYLYDFKHNINYLFIYLYDFKYYIYIFIYLYVYILHIIVIKRNSNNHNNILL